MNQTFVLGNVWKKRDRHLDLNSSDVAADSGRQASPLLQRTVSRCCCLVLALFVVTWTAATWTPVSVAQDQLDRSAPADPNLLPGVDGKIPELRKEPEPFLNWMIRSSGIFGFLILLVSFALISIIMMIALELRRDNYLPASFIQEFEQQMLAKDYQGAFETAKASDSFIGRVVTAGMSRLGANFSYEEAVEQMQQVGEEETMAMEHKIGYLSLISSIAPMLGLLGTVQGMIFCFQTIANSSTTPKPSLLSDGIAMALFTTLEGLVVAIPATVFYSLYKNRLARFLMESGFVADNLMKNFKGISKPSISRTGSGGAAPLGVPAGPRID